MPYRNRIDVKYSIPDTRAEVRLRYFKSLAANLPVKKVELVDSYVTDAPLKPGELKAVSEMLANPLIEAVSVNGSIPIHPKKFDWAIEIGFLPGVTDNVGNTARESIADKLGKKFKNGEGVYTSQVFYLTGKLSYEQVQKIADSLYNPLIQRAKILTQKEFLKSKGFGAATPRVHLSAKPNVTNVNLALPREELEALGKHGIKNPDGSRRGPLALPLPYLKAIKEHFDQLGRKPTDVELETLAQTWSEHCKHTIFRSPIDNIKKGLFKTYIKGATDKIRKALGKKDFCVSVFDDNAGAIVFDNDHIISHKVETHNTPSALDPFGGAITGIVGVNRDCLGFGLGGKPIINIYGFCFADPRDGRVLYRDQNLTQKMLPARRIMEGVVAGINAGGNCSGIPTPQGFVFFDERYIGKPLVFAGTVGILPKYAGKRLSHIKGAVPGDYIVMIGGRVGQDGIHGATFSSVALDEGSPATAVQIGDPITQKKLSDAIVKEARDKNLFNSITDCGAGGLSSAVGEMAKDSNGCIVNLEKVPLKYPGLEPWQIWISESQERMVLAVPKNKWKKFEKLMKHRGVEATVIGQFSDSGKAIVKYRGKTVLDIDLGFLHDGLPIKQLKTKSKKQKTLEPKLPEITDFSQTLLEMLARPNITSFEFISKQYDHEVQAGSVIKPLQGRGRVNGEASVTRPVLDSKKGVVLSQGMYPSYSDIDTYHMAAASIDTAIRNAITAGADPNHLALLDNFCWTRSDTPESLHKLKNAVKACYDYAVAYGTPFISGKDSMFNDFDGFDETGARVKISIPPTLLISSIGVINDVTKSVGIDAKFAGDVIYVLGETNNELGASEYYGLLSDKLGKKYTGNRVPKVNAQKNLALYFALAQAIEKGLIASAISVTRGGLGVALAKTALAGGVGAEISFKNLPGNPVSEHSALFSESQGRILVTVSPDNAKAFEKIMRGNVFAKLGKITDSSRIVIDDIVNVELPSAEKAYKSTLNKY